MGPIIPADLKQEAEDVNAKIEPMQEIKIEPNNESDPQVKMEPDIDPLEIKAESICPHGVLLILPLLVKI